MEIPHKLKNFLWRFYNNNILVRILLRGKGVQTPIVCPMCNRDVEHVLHLFFDCEFARRCWQYVNLIFDMQEVEFATDWLLDKLRTKFMDNLITITKILTGIWFARNKKV